MAIFTWGYDTYLHVCNHELCTKMNPNIDHPDESGRYDQHWVTCIPKRGCMSSYEVHKQSWLQGGLHVWFYNEDLFPGPNEILFKQ